MGVPTSPALSQKIVIFGLNCLKGATALQTVSKQVMKRSLAEYKQMCSIFVL